MLSAFLAPLYRRWRLRSLNAKLLWAVVGLMLMSLLGSTSAFVVSTALTRNRLLKQRAVADAERVTRAMAARVQDVSTSATLLANDSQVFEAIREDDEPSLMALHDRAFVVRDRFGMDLVQIYDRQGRARTNLVLSSLYRESSLLGLVEGSEAVVLVEGGRILLLSRAMMPNDRGAVIAGIDLETELQRLVSQYRLSADLGLSVAGFYIGTHQASYNRADGQYVHRFSMNLGETPVDLSLVRSTAEITHVTFAGLGVMVGSTLLTTLLLMGLSVVVARSVSKPIWRLAAAAEAVAAGDLSQRIDEASIENPLNVGTGDEIGVLATAFNDMVAELDDLYRDLETKVRNRTRELTTAAEIARAMSSSLELDVALRTSVQLIYEQFGFYYVAIFILDPDSKVAVLREAVGEAGQELKTEGFQIDVESRSLVGAAAVTRRPCIVQDVMTNPLYLMHPELLDTGSEVTIPLLVSGTVIGVLDVQSKERGAFAPELVKLLVTLADQIATGVYNAQLYTRQRQTTEHLTAANARLQELDESKNQFIENVSHELRTPLALIRGYAETLESQMLGGLSREQHDAVSIIARRARTMTRLVEDITDLLEVEAQVAPRSLVSLSELTVSAIKDFQILAERNRIALRSRVKGELPKVMGQEHHLRKVLDNLINNALKFTPEGGAVMVEVFQQNGRVMLQVTDTGIGIPRDKQTYVFERFYQVDSSIRRRYGGSGLGLALVKEIVQAHGGEVALESEPGHGSIFTVAIPVADL